jgi:hypothetical protein
MTSLWLITVVGSEIVHSFINRASKSSLNAPDFFLGHQKVASEMSGLIARSQYTYL